MWRTTRARARLAGAGRGGAKGAGERHSREWSAEIRPLGGAWAHNMRMNGPSKSGSSPYGDATSFCRFIFWLLDC
jgi:hypothetical protein